MRPGSPSGPGTPRGSGSCRCRSASVSAHRRSAPSRRPPAESDGAPRRRRRSRVRRSIRSCSRRPLKRRCARGASDQIRTPRGCDRVQAVRLAALGARERNRRAARAGAEWDAWESSRSTSVTRPRNRSSPGPRVVHCWGSGRYTCAYTRRRKQPVRYRWRGQRPITENQPSWR